MRMVDRPPAAAMDMVGQYLGIQGAGAYMAAHAGASTHTLEMHRIRQLRLRQVVHRQRATYWANRARATAPPDPLPDTHDHIADHLTTSELGCYMAVCRHNAARNFMLLRLHRLRAAAAAYRRHAAAEQRWVHAIEFLIDSLL